MPVFQNDLLLPGATIELLPRLKEQPKSSVSSVLYTVVDAVTDLKSPAAYLVLSILFRGGLPDAEIVLDRL